MGNTVSTLAPSSLLHCVDSQGDLDFGMLWHYRRADIESEQEEDDEDLEELARLLHKRHNKDEEDSCCRKKRSCKRVLVEVFDEEGNRKKASPRETYWYLNYVVHPNRGNVAFEKKFRRRFRLPYDQYKKLLDRMLLSGVFDRWNKTDCVGNPSSPLQLLLLGALRYLGRGWTFDDLEESTAINEETHRQFFHVFIQYEATALFDAYVVMPTNAEEAEAHMHEMALAGFVGCCGSADATHVLMERCSYRLRQAHEGYKLQGTARSFNMTVNHRRRILFSTNGHPSRWNNKTLVLFDDFMRGIRNGNVLDDVVFELSERDPNGEI